MAKAKTMKAPAKTAAKAPAKMKKPKSVAPKPAAEPKPVQIDLNAQARQILDLAQKSGVEANFFFVTTFKRYQVQVGILTELEKTIRTEEAIVTKEYVKGRGNIYTHPAIAAYNQTAAGANKTVETLMNIITKMRDDEPDEGDELLDFLLGR